MVFSVTHEFMRKVTATPELKTRNPGGGLAPLSLNIKANSGPA